MLFMRFPIDVLFVDRAGTVVRALPGLRPWVLMAGARGAADVVELRTGTIVASGTQAGDDLVFERPDSEGPVGA